MTTLTQPAHEFSNSSENAQFLLEEIHQNNQAKKRAYQYGYMDLFASRDTLAEALAYADSVISTLPNEHQMPAFAALHVVLNTVAMHRAKTELRTM